MLRKPFAVCCAFALCGVMLSGSPAVFAQEDAAEPIVLPISSKMYYEVKDDSGNVTEKPISDSLITGQISVTIHEHPVHVTIFRYSAEAPLEYYDTDLEPQEGQEKTEYVFLVDYSECPTTPSDFTTTYTSPFLSGTYSAAYTIEISAPKTEDAVYHEDGLLIADPKSEEETITGMTKYAYDVTFTEEGDVPVTASDATASVSETSDLTVSRSIQMLWKPYITGDANGDNAINTMDAYYILLYAACKAAGVELPEGVLPEAADVDGNGAVNTMDAYYVLLYSASVSAKYDVTMDDLISGKMPGAA